MISYERAWPSALRLSGFTTRYASRFAPIVLVSFVIWVSCVSRIAVWPVSPVVPYSPVGVVANFSTTWFAPESMPKSTRQKAEW